MAESIVKVPQDAASDMDFLAFSFNGKHSWDDFGIYRVIDGDRYNENLSPTLTDKTAEVPGGDGMYYFNTYHKQKDFSINFAFDNLSEVQLRDMRKWLNGKEIGDLWFSEAPYKVYSAKVTGQPTIKYIPFDDESGGRVYKGEGTIQFTAYWPYAHTPDFVQRLAPEYSNIEANVSQIFQEQNKVVDKLYVYDKNGQPEQFNVWIYGPDGEFEKESTNGCVEPKCTVTMFTFSNALQDVKLYIVYNGETEQREFYVNKDQIVPILSEGKLSTSYNDFSTSSQFIHDSGLTNTFTPGNNNGDLPTPFVLKQDGYIPAGTKFTVGEAEITVVSECYNLEWDTKTGLVIAGDAITVTNYKEKKPIDVIGDTCATIPVGGVEEIKGEVNSTYNTIEFVSAEKQYSEWIEDNKSTKSTIIYESGTTETVESSYDNYAIGVTQDGGVQSENFELLNITSDSQLSPVPQFAPITGNSTAVTQEFIPANFYFRRQDASGQNCIKYTKKSSSQEGEASFDSKTEEDTVEEEFTKIVTSKTINTSKDYERDLLLEESYYCYKALTRIKFNLCQIPENSLDPSLEEQYKLNIYVPDEEVWLQFDLSQNPFVLLLEGGTKQSKTYSTNYDGNYYDLTITATITATYTQVVIRLSLTLKDQDNEIGWSFSGFDENDEARAYTYTIANNYILEPLEKKEGSELSNTYTVIETTGYATTKKETITTTTEYTRELTNIYTTADHLTTTYLGSFGATTSNLQKSIQGKRITTNQEGIVLAEENSPLEENSVINNQPLLIDYHYWYY